MSMGNVNQTIGDTMRFIQNFKANPNATQTGTTPPASGADMNAQMQQLMPMIMMMMFQMMSSMQGQAGQTPLDPFAGLANTLPLNPNLPIDQQIKQNPAYQFLTDTLKGTPGSAANSSPDFKNTTQLASRLDALLAGSKSADLQNLSSKILNLPPDSPELQALLTKAQAAMIQEGRSQTDMDQLTLLFSGLATNNGFNQVMMQLQSVLGNLEPDSAESKQLQERISVLTQAMQQAQTALAQKWQALPPVNTANDAAATPKPASSPNFSDSTQLSARMGKLFANSKDPYLKELVHNLEVSAYPPDSPEYKQLKANLDEHMKKAGYTADQVKQFDLLFEGLEANKSVTLQQAVNQQKMAKLDPKSAEWKKLNQANTDLATKNTQHQKALTAKWQTLQSTANGAGTPPDFSSNDQLTAAMDKLFGSSKDAYLKGLTKALADSAYPPGSAGYEQVKANVEDHMKKAGYTPQQIKQFGLLFNATESNKSVLLQQAENKQIMAKLDPKSAEWKKLNQENTDLSTKNAQHQKDLTKQWNALAVSPGGQDPSPVSTKVLVDLIQKALANHQFTAQELGQSLKYLLDKAPAGQAQAVGDLLGALMKSGTLNIDQFLDSKYLDNLSADRKEVLMTAVLKAGVTLENGQPNMRFLGFMLSALFQPGASSTKDFLTQFLKRSLAAHPNAQTAEGKVLQNFAALTGTVLG